MRGKANMHRDIDNENGGGAPTDAKPFNELTEEELNSTVEGALKVKEVKEEKKEEKPAEEKKELPADEKKEEEQEVLEEEKPAGEEKKEDEKEKKKEDEQEELPVYKLTKTDEKGKEVEEESTWEAIAELTSVPLEVEKGKTATHEDFNKGIEKRIAIEVAKSDAKNFDNFLNQYPPAAQLVIKALSADPKMDITDVLNPAKDYDEVLAQNDEQLLRDKLENQDKLAKDEIDEEVERIKGDGRLIIEAKKIRNVVTENKNIAIQNFLSKKSAVYDAAIQRRVDLEKSELEAMNKIIESTNEYLGGKIPDEIKKTIRERNSTGYYKKLFAADPAKAYQAILSHELGEQAKTRLLGKGKSEGVKSTAETLLNKKVPIKENASAVKKEPKGPEEGTDTFDSWDAISTQTVGVTHGK